MFLDGLSLKRSWGGEVLAVAEGSKEDKASWTAFLWHLKERGLKGVRLFVSDKCLGLVESLGEFYPEAQRCAVHFYRNVWTAVPRSNVKEVAATPKAIADEQPSGETVARSKAKNACGGSVSRWQIGADAGGGKTASRGRHEVGHASLNVRKL